MVAEGLEPPGGLGPEALEILAGSGERGLAPAANPEVAALVEAAEEHRGEAVACERLLDLGAMLDADLEHGPQLFVEESGQEPRGVRVGPDQGSQLETHAGVAGKGHLGEGHEEAAVGAIVVREHQSRSTQLGECRVEPLDPLRLVQVRRLVARLPEHLGQDRPTESHPAPGEGHQHEAGLPLVCP